jgi:hypothetical protein
LLPCPPINGTMAPAAAFAEVLERSLDHAPIRDAAAAGRSTFSPAGVGTRSLFWFEGASSIAPRREAVAAPRRDRSSEHSGPHPAPSVTTPQATSLRLVRSEPRVARPPRLLSAAQRDALNQMIGLGARLDDTFTLEELRSEFRALARLYHPDRHLATRRAGAGQAANSFVTLRSAYDLLKKAA